MDSSTFANISGVFDGPSLELFFSSFAISKGQDDSRPLFLDFLPRLYATARPGSCLHSAVTTVARLHFANRYSGCNGTAMSFGRWTTAQYARTLATTNVALSYEVQAYTDETLTAVWLLSLYEVLLSDSEPHNQPKITPWRNHIDGSIGLLVARGSKQLETSQGRQLFILVHTTSIIMTMMAKQCPSPQLSQLVEVFLMNAEESAKGEFIVASHLQNVASSRFMLWNTCSSIPSKTTNSMKSAEVLEQAMRLTQASYFEDWALSQDGWQPRLVSTELKLESLDTAYASYYFESIFVMSNWVTYWTACLLLKQSIVDFLLASESGSTASKDTIISVLYITLQYELRALAVDILGSISFAFHEISYLGKCCKVAAVTSNAGSSIGAIHVFWPLGAILASQYTTQFQKQLARKALREVGDRFGIAQALKYV